MTETSPSRSPRGPYAKSAAIRQKVIDVCIDAFGSSGFYGTTMKDIAALADMSYTGLLHHFPSKTDLLIEVLETRHRESEYIFEDPEHLDLHSVATSLIRHNAKRPGLIQLYTVITAEGSVPSHPAHESISFRMELFRSFLIEQFRKYRDEDRLLVDAEPQSLANLLMAAFDGLQLQWLYAPDSVDIEKSVADLIAALVRGDQN